MLSLMSHLLTAGGNSPGSAGAASLLCTWSHAEPCQSRPLCNRAQACLRLAPESHMQECPYYDFRGSKTCPAWHGMRLLEHLPWCWTGFRCLSQWSRGSVGETHHSQKESIYGDTIPRGRRKSGFYTKEERDFYPQERLYMLLGKLLHFVFSWLKR
ncbi:unnamed protein product [Lepidochelys kempii]